MKSRQLILLCLSILFISLTACSKDDDDSKTTDDEEWTIPTVQQLSASDFSHYVVGKGWKCMGSRKINDDGSIAKEDYYKSYADDSPEQYYVATDILTSFLHSFALNADCYYNRTYAYAKNSNSVILKGYDYLIFRILSVDDTTMKVIRDIHTSANDKSIYLFCIYKKMTDSELANYLNTYKTDYNSLLKN